MKLIIFLFTFSIFSTVGLCQTQEKADAVNESEIRIKSKTAAADELRISLVESVFEWPDVARKSDRYLRIDGDRKPSSSLRKRLEDKGMKFSSSFWKKGLRVWISKLNWVSDTHVEATAGYEAGNMAAGSCNYKIELVEGLWKITSKDGCMIS